MNQNIEKMSIRLMVEEDSAAVAELFSRCFTDAWSLKSVQEMFSVQGYHNLLAYDEENGAIFGYIGCYMVLDEADITNVCVDPSLRGRGIARLLLKHFLEDMQKNEIHQVFLEVRASNEPAIALYSHAGFVKNGIRKNYYSNPKEDAHLMVWQEE